MKLIEAMNFASKRVQKTNECVSKANAPTGLDDNYKVVHFYEKTHEKLQLLNWKETGDDKKYIPTYGLKIRYLRGTRKKYKV